MQWEFELNLNLPHHGVLCSCVDRVVLSSMCQFHGSCYERKMAHSKCGLRLKNTVKRDPHKFNLRESGQAYGAP
jgi:hypothetical protein